MQEYRLVLYYRQLFFLMSASQTELRLTVLVIKGFFKLDTESRFLFKNSKIQNF